MKKGSAGMSNSETSRIEAAILRARLLHKQAADSWAAGETDGEAGSSKPRMRRSTAKHTISCDGLRNVAMDREMARENRVLTLGGTTSKGHGPYRMLRTRLMQRMRANDWRVLGVSAAGEGEGKTLTALNLAISIAAEVGQEAVLLELDLRRPSVYKRLGIAPNDFTGVADYLRDETKTIEDLLFSPGIDRLGCVLSSDPLERSSDLLASPRGQLLFQELREKLLPRTVVVVDLPPLLSTDDALVVAPMIDAMLFVVAEGQTPRHELVEAQHILKEINVIGTVLNKSVEKDQKKYY